MDYIKMITDRKAAFAGLHTRMDKDADLLKQKEFTLFDKDDREAPDVENLTLADAAIFVSHVQAVLAKATKTTEVEGEGLKDEETSLFESFFRDWAEACDENLNKRGFPDAYNWNVHQICGRGSIISRLTMRMDGDKFVPGLLPLDARYVIYDTGVNGLKWVAPEFSRTKTQIIDEYGEEVGGKVNATSAIVTDLYIDEWERVFIGGEQIKEQKHGYNELPFIIQACPAGLMFQDGDMMERNGESLLHLARNLYASKNKMASILDTINMLTIFGGLQKEEADIDHPKPPKLTPYGKRFVAGVEKGTKGYFPMPITDIRMATRLLYSILDSNIQDATLPRVSYGTLQAPTSGVGIAQLKEAEDPVYLPRIKALELYYQRLYRMALNQYVSQKLNVKLGTPGFLKQYLWSELKKDVSIKCKIELLSPMLNMANISIAAAVGGLLSDDTKLRKYIRVDNPEEETAKKWAEMAAKVSPAIAKYNMAQALADAGDEIRARLMAEEMGLTLDQLLSGELEQKPTPQPEEPKQLLPMFSGESAGIRKGIESLPEEEE